MKIKSILTNQSFWCAVVAILAGVLRLLHQDEDIIRVICDIVINLAAIYAILKGKPWSGGQGNDGIDDQ